MNRLSLKGKTIVIVGLSLWVCAAVICFWGLENWPDAPLWICVSTGLIGAVGMGLAVGTIISRPGYRDRA